MSIELAEPWFLLLLPLAIGMLFWRRGRRASFRYSSLTILSGAPRAWAPGVVGELLRVSAVVCVIVALTGPRSPDLKTRVPAEAVSIMFVLDTSGSMQETTFLWNNELIARAEAARRALHLFVAGGDGPDGSHFDGRSTERGTDSVGLVTFTNWPQPVCPPTLNHSVFLSVLDRVPAPTVRDTGTNIGDAIAEGVHRLDRTTGKQKVLILLTDGEHNVDLADRSRQPLKPRQAASLAKSLGIKVYTIDTGGDAPANDADAVKRRLDGRRVNEAIAEMTEGRAFSASDGSQLLDVCRQIDELERQPILAPVYRRYRHHAAWLTLIGVVLASLAFGLEQTVWRRMP